MRMRLGFVTGFAAGYVLGAKAGQERYQQIVDLARRAMGSEQAQQLQEELRTAADRVSEKASEQVQSLTSKLASDESAGDSLSVGLRESDTADISRPTPPV